MKVLMHTYFLGLAAVGYDALWGSMVRNGTAQAIGAAKTSGLLADGSLLRPLRAAVPVLYGFLASPVIFYDALTRDANPVYRSLLVSLFSTMQTTAVCIVAGGGGTRPWLTVLESLFWGVWNQSHGAAFVYPVYFFTHLRGATDASAEEPVSTPQAEALLYTSVLAAALPAWLLYPAFFPCSGATRQALIASYRLSPAVLALARPAFAGAIRRLRATPLPGSTARPLVQSALLLSGACAALGHLYALACSAASPAAWATLQAVFWPGATSVDRSSGTVIAQGCHLFLQNDWLVICAAVVPYASAVLASACRRLGANRDGSWVAWAENGMRSLNGRFVALAAMAAVFSPGAVLAWTMAAGA